MRQKGLAVGLIALAVGSLLVWIRHTDGAARDQVTTPAIVAYSAAPEFDMLAYLDTRVALQENEKDVRCWSSFNKLQMFITQAEIDEEAKGIRIDRHMDLIESLWRESKQSYDVYIPAASVTRVLEERFPRSKTATGIRFALGGSDVSVEVDEKDLRDYGDTIEPWRLLQTWASHHTDDAGKLMIKPAFDEAALGVLYDFFKAFDLAILKRARDIAAERRLHHIDGPSMDAAFEPRRN